MATVSPSRAPPSGVPGAALAACLMLAAPAPARAGSGFERYSPVGLQPRGAHVGTSLLVEYYAELPERQEGDDPEAWAGRLQKALDGFKKKVGQRYTEGTLQRLLTSPDVQARRAAVLALGMHGGMRCNEALAGRLHDEDSLVRQMTTESLWLLWFRGDSEENRKELQRLTRLRDAAKAMAGLDALIRKAPDFAEAYNQRAILHFRARDLDKSVADCEKVLQLNPYHFGALSGMGQCYLQLKKPRAALKVFRNALRVHPHMDGIEDTVRALESALGEEGKKDDRK